jgi:hypothetical protein
MTVKLMYFMVIVFIDLTSRHCSHSIKDLGSNVLHILDKPSEWNCVSSCSNFYCGYSLKKV